MEIPWSLSRPKTDVKRTHSVYNEEIEFCGILYRVRNLFTIKPMLKFYHSYAKSIITYGLLIYGSASKTDLQRLENCYRRIFRAIIFERKLIFFATSMSGTTC